MPACAESEVIMNKNRPKGNQKHIDLSGRIRIEQGLNNGESFRSIARDLNKDPRACLKNAFCKMCVTICGRFRLNEGCVAGYAN